MKIKSNDPKSIHPKTTFFFLAVLVNLFLILTVTAATPTIGEDLPGSYLLGEQKALYHEAADAATLDSDTEPTANMKQYDVLYYDIALDIDPSNREISGEVNLSATVVEDEISFIELNFYDNMDVQACTANGAPATFSRDDNILTIDLERSYHTGETVSAGIFYSGTPSQAVGAFVFDNHAGLDHVWSLSEPFGARTWWPCKDYQEDKPDSLDISITVPEEMKVASNGLLTGAETGNGVATYHWHESHPIATYLVSIACYPYETYSDFYHPASGDSMEISFFVYPDHMGRVQKTYAMVPDMIGIYADMYGEYPFLDEKYGHAEFGWPGGMEHQTITSLGGWTEYLIVHELAHQWWGDMITCSDFHHIWLNEGFATYSEALYTEQMYGEDAFHEYINDLRYLGDGTVYCPDLSDWGRIFDGGLSYYKGAWVLHMLRHVVGDDAFFEILHQYHYDPRYQYSSASTEDFRDICENVSGMDLHTFFDQWIYGEYYPIYEYDWTYEMIDDGYVVNLNLLQKQSGTIFEMPVDVAVFEEGGTRENFVVQNDSAEQQFLLPTSAKPESLSIDPEGWILKISSKPIENPTFDKGILLVNGVFWAAYGNEIYSAYEDSIFTGTLSFDFWDMFQLPDYPPYLPEPMGHGPIPENILKQYSTVVWIGNNYFGDLTDWMDTPILSYLETGGNVLLMARMGRDFLIQPLIDRLGLEWRGERMNTLDNCIAEYPGLQDMSFTGTQTYCAMFDTVFSREETELLFTNRKPFSSAKGIGAFTTPTEGGAYRPEGGRFAFLSMRPYRTDHSAMRFNTNRILRTMMLEPWALQVTVTPATEVHPGDTLNFDYEIINRSLAPVETMAWLEVVLPGGRLLQGGPLAGPVPISLDPGETMSGTLGAPVPLFAPCKPGYTLIIAVGDYPETTASGKGEFDIIP